jgi:hypothetical protein
MRGKCVATDLFKFNLRPLGGPLDRRIPVDMLKLDQSPGLVVLRFEFILLNLQLDGTTIIRDPVVPVLVLVHRITSRVQHPINAINLDVDVLLNKHL